MFRILAATIVTAALSFSSTLAGSTDRDSSRDDGRSLVIEGLEKLRQGIERLIDRLPLYGPPRITEEGDIILRRLDPKERRDAPQSRTEEDGVDL